MRNALALLSITLFGFTFSTHADLTIVQHVDGAGQNSDTTVKIKGDRERIDLPSKPSEIIDGKSGQMIHLMNDRKSFVKISADQVKAAAETIGKDNGVGKPAPKLTPTGRKETINGYETEEFTFQTPQYKASFWVAKSYPDGAGILKEMQAPMSGAWTPSNMGMPDYTDFPGLPMRTVISMGNNQMTTTIVSIKKDPINAAEFEIPKDFQDLTKTAGAPPARAANAGGSPSATP
jgi:hypothetical protein